MSALRKIFIPGEVQMKSDNSREFQAYGNVKNIVDKALDVAMDGCYTASIERHKQNNTMPSMLWSHDAWSMPVGVYTDMAEDSKGLLLNGRLSKTSAGNDLYELAMDGAIKKFSIGYIVNQERWNSDKGHNELIEIDIRECSWVNFACNDESELVDIKSTLADNSVPTKRELERFLKAKGMSKHEARRIAGLYHPEEHSKSGIDIEVLKESTLFK